jgi:hypothetical protein
MALHSFLVLAILRNKASLYHVTVIISCLLYELTLHGTAYQYIWPNSLWWTDRSVEFFLGIALASSLAFSRTFLNTPLLAPRLDRVLVVLLVCSLAASAGKLTDLLTVNYLIHIVSLISPFALLISALWCVRKGHRGARFFIAAWGLMLLGASSLNLVGLGVLPYRFGTVNLFHLGVVMAPLLFSLALGERLRFLERSYRAELTRQVEERTRELREALERVKTLRGLIPICARCKKVRDDQGYWNSIEEYVQSHSEADFTHGICPACMRQLYGSQVVERVELIQRPVQEGASPAE